MLKAVIVEDEQLSSDELKAALSEVAPEIEVIAVARSLSDAVPVLRSSQYDLVFMDIHLGDGNSFTIFEKVDVKVPVIFITAFDDYALKAFENKGIDYLLKPFSRDDLRRAIDKLKMASSIDMAKTGGDEPSGAESLYRERFMVTLGDKIRSLTTGEIAYFTADGKYLHLVTNSGEDFIIDYTLAELTELLNPKQFFRINRKYLVNYRAIKDMVRYSGNRIKVTLFPPVTNEAEAIVSGDRVNEFKVWLNK